MIGKAYTSFDQKSFSRDERNFYNTLSNGIDENLLYVVSWLKTHEAAELLEIEDEDEFDEAFLLSGLHAELNKRIQKNTLTGIKPLSKFYKVGSRLGHNQLHRTQVYTEQDKEALSILNQYVGDTIYSVNVDSCLNMKDILMAGALAGLGIAVLAKDILQSPYKVTPRSGATVDRRCTMITTTEYGRAVNTGLLQSYVNNGVYKVDIVTAGDDRVCDDCLEIEQNNPYTIEEAMGLLPVHANCYDKETEVFTNHGWKYFKDVNDNDKILSLNPDTHETEFINYTQKIEHKNEEGYMYHIHNKWFDTCVTPEHDCFILQRKMIDTVRDYYPEFRKPYELNSESYFLRVAENNNISPEYIDVNGLKFTSRDYAFFMAWYLSEGSVLHNPITAKSKSYPIKITQIKEHNRIILEKEFNRIADYLNIKLYVGKEYFEFHSKELHDYLQPLGYSYEKYIPEELFKLSREDLNVFLDNYIRGDGAARKNSPGKLNITNSIDRNIFTTSVKLVDGLSYIILLAGFCPSIYLSSEAGTVVKHSNGVYASNHDCYNISVNNSKKAIVDHCTIDKVPYDDMVYCLELPKYHTLWTRRNGKTCWNGNCRCSMRASNDGLVDPELTKGFVVNMTDNDYNINDTSSPSGDFDYDFTLN